MASPTTGVPTLRYPFKAIKDFDDYLEIQIVKYEPPKFSSGADNVSFATSYDLLKKVIPKYTIILPIPQTLQDSNSVAWGDDSLNGIQATGLQAATQTIKSPNLPKALINSLSNVLKQLESTVTVGNGQDLVTSFFAGQVVNSLGANVDTSSILSRSTGQVLNPNMELLFKGVSLREFSFEFDFAPRDGSEANQVKQIIRTFKQEMAAKTTSDGSKGSGLFISAPSVFKLEYKSGGKKHQFLNSFKPMAMKGMSVNYTGSGTYAVYGDSTPVHMKLGITFQELNPIYFEDYNNIDVGVGF